MGDEMLSSFMLIIGLVLMGYLFSGLWRSRGENGAVKVPEREEGTRVPDLQTQHPVTVSPPIVQGLQSGELYPEPLVQRVNELYHDITANQYEGLHPEIFQQERERLYSIAERFLQFTYSVIILEIGTGTGFVPVTVGGLLRNSDTFICSDISAAILKVAEDNVRKQQFAATFKFVKIDSQTPFRLPFEQRSMDAVVMNAVLHHIRDTATFLHEVSRVLKPHGLLVISHEPNRYFRDNRFLWCNYVMMGLVTHPVLILHQVLRKRPVLQATARRVYHCISPTAKERWLNKSQRVADRINAVLLAEQVISTPVPADEIERIVDVRWEGFTPDVLLSGFRLLHLETYNHMLWVTIRHYNNGVIRTYDRILRRIYPKSGATFLAVFRKETDRGAAF